MPPAQTFAKLCHSDRIVLPTPASRLAFLADAAVSASDLPARQVAEQCAALAWARSSLAAETNPASWQTTLPADLYAVLTSLYVLPPHWGAAPAPSDADRLARMISLYSPEGPDDDHVPLRNSRAASTSRVPTLRVAPEHLRGPHTRRAGLPLPSSP